MSAPRRNNQFPAYQIDFQIVSTGKMVAQSKRRIRWRFGFPNLEALAAKQTGTDCRGEEHDVTVSWSITSGKRMIMADGHQVHHSTKRSDILEFSWTLRGHHVVKVIAHAAPPMAAVPGFRQYDLFLDGMTFFNFPKVYELGIESPRGLPHPGQSHAITNGPSQNRAYDLRTGQYIDAPRTAQEEEEALQAAIRASLEESKEYVEGRANNSGPQRAITNGQEGTGQASAGGGYVNSAPPPTDVDLLDFTSEPSMSQAAPPTDTVPASSSFDPNSNNYDMFSAVPDAFAVQPYQGNTQAPPPAYQNYAVPEPQKQQPQQSYSKGGYPAAGPAPSHDAAGWGQASAPPPAAAAVGMQQQQNDHGFGFASPPPPSSDPFAPQPPAPAPAPTFNDVSNSILGAYSSASGDGGDEFAQDGGGSVGGAPEVQQTFSLNDSFDAGVKSQSSGADDVMSKLVNFDDLNSAPVNHMNRLTLNPSEDSQASKKKNGKKGIPPMSFGTGPQPTLAEMNARKANAPTNVMQSNSMVVHQTQQSGNYGYGAPPSGGPPPLQKQTGFGAGAQMGMGYGGGPGVPPPPQHQGGYGYPQQQQQQQQQQGMPMQYQQQQQQQYQGGPPPPHFQYQQQQQQQGPPRQQYPF